MNDTINEIEISNQHKIPAAFWKKIDTSDDAADVLHTQWNKNTIGLNESFKVLLLNNAHKVKGIYQISQGGITGTLIDNSCSFCDHSKNPFCIYHPMPQSSKQCFDA